jgi:hypothetical protein
LIDFKQTDKHSIQIKQTKPNKNPDRTKRKERKMFMAHPPSEREKKNGVPSTKQSGT